MTEPSPIQEKKLIPVVVCLTENKPIQCKDISWASEATADLLPNYEDLRFPYKGSSLLCPNCGKPLAGKPREAEESPEQTETKGKGKKKPKPWEIHIQDVHHEKPEDEAACQSPADAHPHGKLLKLIESAHQITWIRAWRERAAHPEENRNQQDIETDLLKGGTTPKLIASTDEESQEVSQPQRKDTLF